MLGSKSPYFCESNPSFMKQNVADPANLDPYQKPNSIYFK